MHGECTTPLTVTSLRSVAAGITELVLENVEGGPLPSWQAGSHIDLQLGPDLVRQYSLCGSTDDRGRWRIAVLREPQSRGGSAALCERVQVGDVLLATGPRNHFELQPSPRYLFIAGGIGITPIIPMIALARAAGADWRLVYGGRTEASMAYRTELRSADPDRVLEWPQDRCGLIDLDGLLGRPEPDTLIYCCGPEPLIAAVEAKSRHWPPGTLHVERFAPRPATGPVLNGPFEIELVDSDAVLMVPPDMSILEVVDQAGIYVLSNCEEGTCGTCQTTVLGGLPDHRDSILDEDERASNDTMMICVSRSLTPRLVLDL
ncbi:PDR/VanB family oxidoreductase [Microlunatus panaciterrae]|uniref:Ferredoxin-NADP reductase n=1 Tax=Microlunatus panaciterrae TaxID=400768 RepID=A0ABS2RND6_9ACTN|nr:PDR/VanB family oxidoreductase [Microlunatus panaciterrae]MBM7800526.1 ferredoxin-NADP reductase [Microlunatus panaciterrae]